MEAFIDAGTEAGFFIPRRMAPDLLYQWIEGVQKHDDEYETNYHRILDLLRYLEPKDLFVFLETVYSDPDRIDEDITEAVSELTLQMCESGEFNDEDLIRAAYPYQVCLFDDPDLTFERLRELVLLVGQQEKYHPIGFDGYNALITYCSIEMLHKLGFENMRQLIIDVVGDEECGVFFEWNYKHKFDENNPVVQWAFLYCAFDDLKEFIAENDDEDEASGDESRDDFVMLFVGPTPADIMQAQRDLLINDVIHLMERHFDGAELGGVVNEIDKLFAERFDDLVKSLDLGRPPRGSGGNGNGGHGGHGGRKPRHLH